MDNTCDGQARSNGKLTSGGRFQLEGSGLKTVVKGLTPGRFENARGKSRKKPATKKEKATRRNPLGQSKTVGTHG